jgi:hypothetical protein
MRCFPVVVILAVHLAPASPAQDISQQKQAADSASGLPHSYAENYLIARATISPNQKFAVIYPKEPPDTFPQGKDLIISLQPFAIVGTLETKWPYFHNENHGAIKGAWSRNGSVAMITLEAKWGPQDVFLLEFRDHKLSRTTNLLAKAHNLLVADYRKAEPERYNDFFDFIFEDESESGSSFFLEDAKLVRINAKATTDPKQTAGTRAWDAGIVATWDIAQAKFTSSKVTRLFAGVRKGE